MTRKRETKAKRGKAAMVLGAAVLAIGSILPGAKTAEAASLSLADRVARVREAAQAKGEMDPAPTRGSRTDDADDAQEIGWINWGNWGNWGNWNNWTNWSNFWSNWANW